MPALNFVAADDGLEEDPKLRTLARVLRVSRPLAFWFVLRWQRLILHCGNHLIGSLPKNYTADDVASFLEFEGPAARLIEALRRQGFLAFRRGRGFFYPDWKDTTTGRYAARREEDRRWHEKKRAESRVATVGSLSDDVVRQSYDASADSLSTSSRKSIERKKEGETGGPPDPPPPGGASLADARWSWLNDNAPTPQNREVCRRLLSELNDADWAQVQDAYGRLGRPGASISKKNARVLHWPTDVFLRKQAFLRFKPARRRLIKPPGAPTNGAAAALQEVEARLTSGDTFVRELLMDSEIPEDRKAAARARWLSDPHNKNRPRPWELAPSAGH